MSLSTSVKAVQDQPEKAHMFQYASLMLLSEIKQKMELMEMRTFTSANIKKLRAAAQEDFDLLIDEAEDKTPDRLTLFIATIGEAIKALKSIKGGGRSGDGQEGSLTQLDRDVKMVFSSLFSANEDKVASQGEGTGEELGTSNPPPKMSNVWDKFNLNLDPAAIKRVRNVLVGNCNNEKPPATTPVTSGRTPELVTPPAPATASSSSQRQPSSSSSSGRSARPDHESRRQKVADSHIKRRFCHVKGLRETSELMVKEAVSANPLLERKILVEKLKERISAEPSIHWKIKNSKVISCGMRRDRLCLVEGNAGDVAAEARRIMSEDKWDVYGKSIAQLMAAASKDELEHIMLASDMLSKIYRDATDTDVED